MVDLITARPPSARLLKVSAGTTFMRLARTRDPLAMLERAAADSGGRLVRLNLGAVRPYLVLHPDHAKAVLRDSAGFPREGMLWKPIKFLEGYGLAGEGEQWKRSREVLQPHFTFHRTRAAADEVGKTVSTAVAEIVDRAGDEPVDVISEMTRVTQRVMIGVFFGDQISNADADRLGDAISLAFASLTSRTLLPMVPRAVRMPGDRAFNKAVAIANEVIFPLVDNGRDGDHLVNWYRQAVDTAGKPFSRQGIRDDLVGMFVAGTETTALALTWWLLLLDAHPGHLRQVVREIRSVVTNDATPRGEYLPRLPQTRMSLLEALRLYPVGWFVPRTVAVDQVIGGVPIPAGATVVVSPYLTHRLPGVIPDPHVFRPSRHEGFIDGNKPLPGTITFGHGPHNCLGQYLALMEAPLALIELLLRRRPEIVGPRSLRPAVATTLRPKVRPKMRLHPWIAEDLAGRDVFP